MKWNVYYSERDRIVRKLSHHFPKKDRGRADFAEKTLKKGLTMFDGPISPMQYASFVAETEWTKIGAPTFFPESSDMLHMLWGANMKIGVEDLELDKFPRVFSVAWPECEIAGHKLRGCLLWWVGEQDEYRSYDKFNKDNDVEDDIGQLPSSNTKNMISFFFNTDSADCVREISMLKTEAEKLGEILDSSENFNRFGNEKRMALGTVDWKVSQNIPEEQAYIISRLAIRLMVYMRACPDKVQLGYPEGRGAREFCSRWTNLQPMIVKEPTGMRGTHGSPCAHWRTWHFRSYPVKKDGTKKVGVVFVSGTVVGADVDPSTVEDPVMAEAQ